MVSQEDCCFISSHWAVMIISGVFIGWGFFLLFAGVLMAVNLEDNKEYTKKKVIDALGWGLAHMVIGTVGLIGSISLTFGPMVSFAIMRSIVLDINLYNIVFEENESLIQPIVEIVFDIAILINSWILVFGIKSETIH